mmetsp:Transcript_9436/g.26294  ORF Transcript_9436/g.26294 Transcript_9436/m.26294 type:complete len:268 (-) Transcript_9436:46-849(-)
MFLLQVTQILTSGTLFKLKLVQFYVMILVTFVELHNDTVSHLQILLRPIQFVRHLGQCLTMVRQRTPHLLETCVSILGMTMQLLHIRLSQGNVLSQIRLEIVEISNPVVHIHEFPVDVRMFHPQQFIYISPNFFQNLRLACQIILRDLQVGVGFRLADPKVLTRLVGLFDQHLQTLAMCRVSFDGPLRRHHVTISAEEIVPQPLQSALDDADRSTRTVQLRVRGLQTSLEILDLARHTVVQILQKLTHGQRLCLRKRRMVLSTADAR